jgi:hypothetical protein
VGTRRQAENHDAGIGIAKPRHRFSPVIMIAVSAALLARNLLAIFDEPRTQSASDDFVVEIL